MSAIPFLLLCCSSSDDPTPVEPDPGEKNRSALRCRLSYLNQILDKGGVYKINGAVQNPYKIFADAGTGIARFRLWHNPTWTKTVYGDAGEQLYNDLYDVEQSIKKARENNMKILP